MSGHSPLGFSGAERYINCPGSVALIASLPEGAGSGADPEYRVAGVGAHAAWAHCLREGLEAWEVTGETFEGYTITPKDAEAGQVYIDLIANIREEFASPAMGEGIEIEYKAKFHPLAWGTLDYTLISGPVGIVVDYKNGEGIWIEADNPQTKGYGCLLADRYPEIEQFRLYICQPRCAGDGPRIRSIEMTRDELMAWRDSVLLPAMNATEADLKSGPWCRFCRAKDANACPALPELAATVASSAPLAERLSNEALGSLYARAKEVMAIHLAALEKEVMRRRLAGQDVPGTKTVLKKAWRIWKDTAQTALQAALGDDVLSKPVLLTPAAIEDKFGKRAAKLVAEYAYSPASGYTVAPLSDRRRAVNAPDNDPSVFDNFVDNNEKF